MAESGAAPTPACLRIQRDSGDTFPAPWATRAFALANAAQEQNLFTAGEWAEALGAAIARQPDDDSSDPESYWRAWLSAFEALLAEKRVAPPETLADLREAWRRAAEATPHGEPIELKR